MTLLDWPLNSGLIECGNTAGCLLLKLLPPLGPIGTAEAEYQAATVCHGMPRYASPAFEGKCGAWGKQGEADDLSTRSTEQGVISAFPLLIFSWSAGVPGSLFPGRYGGCLDWGDGWVALGQAPVPRPGRRY